MATYMVDSDLVDSDLPRATQLLNIVTEQVVMVTSHIQNLIKRVQDGSYRTSKGLSFLDLRYQLLLFYLQDVTHLISLKSEGGTLKENGALDRLVTVRTVLEKMRPLDQKLRYQIDKLVRTALTGNLAENDPLQFHPNPDNLVSKLSESEDSEDELQNEANFSRNKETAGTSRKFVPPRIAPMHYDGDMTEADREKDRADKLRRAALRSSLIQELRQQYSDAPEEIHDRSDFQTARESREQLHRKEYEESMMVRLAMPHREKSKRKRGILGMSSQLSSITRFGDITALTGGEGQDVDNAQPKKKKKIMKKKTKRRAFKKHR